MAESTTYFGYELLIRSEMAVPGACPVDVMRGTRFAPDIEIVFGVVPVSSGVASAGLIACGEQEICFEVAEVGRYLCRAGRHITVEPCDGASEQRIGDHLVATALPVLLWMRHREVVLHAAGVMLAGQRRAIAVCGGSGSGKSTVLRALLEKGARIIGDDTLRVTFDDAMPQVSGLPARYCWDEKPGEQRVSHAVTPTRMLAHAPLAAIFVLTLPRLSRGFLFTHLTSAKSLEAVLNQRHRPSASRLLGRSKEDLALMVKLAGLPVLSWQRGENSLSLSDEELGKLYQLGTCLAQNLEMAL